MIGSNAGRRLLSIAGLLAVGILMTVASPLLFPLALLADLALGGGLPRTRGLAFLVAYAGFEIAGVVAAVGIALRNLLESDPERAGRRWFRLQVWWASGLLAAGRACQIADKASKERS